MKNFLKLSFAAVAAMFVFGLFGAAKANAQNILPEILKRMDAHQKALKSLKANVMMDTFNSQLNEHDISEGSVQYVPTKGRDALARIDWVKPQQEILSVASGTYVLYQPRLKQAYVGNTKGAQGSGKANNALAFMSMSKSQLNANYSVKYMGTETISGGVEAWHLELIPKTPQNYRSAELWVDTNGMPIQAKIVENNGDSKTILLSNLQKNQTVNTSNFKLNLPKDTKIIKV